MKIAKNLLTLLVIVALIAGGIYYYRKFNQPKPEDIYRFDEVTQGDVEQTVSANGTLNPVTLVSVGTQVSGIVRKLYVDFNDKVEKNQVLLELDNSLFMAQIAQSQGSVRNNQAAVELAQANEKRMRELYAQEFVSKQEMDTAVQVLKSARAQLDTARGLLARDQTNLGFSIIRSPVSGVVVDRVVDVGQTVAASFQTPTLIKIAQDLSKMQINSSFAEADIGNIKVGQEAKFNVDAFPNRDFIGTVKQVRLNAVNTSNVVTYDVVISVDNPDQTLLPGMTAYVNIGVAKRNDVLLVPNAALRYKPKDDQANGKDARAANRERGGPKGKGGKGRKGGEGSKGAPDDLGAGKVYVLQDGKPALVRVRTGITDGRNTEIISHDLQPGTKIIVGEMQGDNKAASGGNMRGPRMF
jgi:HlyD family secretion protein